MVFLSSRMPSLTLEERVSERLNLHEENSEPEDIFMLDNRCDSPASLTLEESLTCSFGSLNDPLTLDTYSISDGTIPQDHNHSREISPDWTNVNQDNDATYLSGPNDLLKIPKSNRTNKAKTYVLELGAGFLGTSDRSTLYEYNRTKPNNKYGVESKDFFNNYEALASV